MKRSETEHALLALARAEGWSKHKLKSLRGQMLSLPEEERRAFLQRLMRKGTTNER